ncbi:unnamed protein product [Tenebrio molitor]|nr:unnamed protein product [Tenebrio molitor]
MEKIKESAVKTIWNTSAKMLQENLRKRETPATQNAKFYKQSQKNGR